MKFHNVLEISLNYVELAARQQHRQWNIWNIYVQELSIRRSDIIRRFCDLHIKNAKLNREFGRLGRKYLEDLRLSNKVLSDPNYIPRRSELEVANARLTCILDKKDKFIDDLTKKKNCQK